MIVDRPAWHHDALCSGDGPDVWSLGQGGNVAPLRAICRRCPVSTDCMLEALAEDPVDRKSGPVRVGVTGPRAWSTVRWLVAELDPITRSDWEMFVSMVLDEGLVEETKRQRRPDRRNAPDRRRRAVELHAAGMTAEDVADELGVHWVSVYRYLRTA